MPTPRDVGQWMLDELKASRALDHGAAVVGIESRFGPEFVYTNESGGASIDRRVLRHFRNLAERDGWSVEWDRYDHYWTGWPGKGTS